jgi:hypothetical protein
MVFAGGCLLDDSDDKSDTTKEPTSIGELTMGGGVFYLRDEGYAFAEFGTFFDNLPYDKARVFVNGLELKNSGGIFTNDVQIPPALIVTGKPVRMVVYALGDSSVHEVALPEQPSIVKPLKDAQLATGKDFDLEIDYPGEHRVISMALTNQDNVALAVETNEKKLTMTVPGSKLNYAGECLLTAVSTNTSGEIPEGDFNLNKQYVLFTVSSMVMRTVTFAK